MNSKGDFNESSGKKRMSVSKTKAIPKGRGRVSLAKRAKHYGGRPSWNPRRISADYKSSSSGSAFKEGILEKIVDHVKASYMDGEDGIYTFNDLLKKSNLGCVTQPVKEWLQTEGLPNSSFIKCALYVDGITRYEYLPPLSCRNQTELIEYLKCKYNESGEGTLKSDILLSVPNADRVLQMLQNQVSIFTRHDKDEVVFYSPTKNLEVPSCFSSLIPKVSVFGIIDKKIEMVLNQNGFKPHRLQAQDSDGGRTPQVGKSGQLRRKVANTTKFKDNEHVQDLEVYS